MNKTSSRIMGLALTIAVLVSLIVGILPVSAAAPSSLGIYAQSYVISTGTNYRVRFDGSSFGLATNASVATPAVGAVTPFSVAAGASIYVATTGVITMADADPGATLTTATGTVANALVAGANTITVPVAGGFLTFSLAHSTTLGTAIVIPAGTFTYATTVAVAVGDTLNFNAANTFVLAYSDPALNFDGTVAALNALTGKAVAANDVAKFSITNVLAFTAAATTYWPANLNAFGTGSSVKGAIRIKYQTGFTLPAVIQPTSVLVDYNTTPSGFSSLWVTPTSYAGTAALAVSVNNTTNEITIVPTQTGLPTNVAHYQVWISGLTNPVTPNTYTVSAETSTDNTYIDGTVAITAAPAPTNLNLYNSAGLFLGQYTTFAQLPSPLSDGSIIKLDPATYYLTASFTTSAANIQIIPSTGSAADTKISTDALGTWSFTLNGTGDLIRDVGIVANSSVSGSTAPVLNITGTSDVVTNVTTTSAINVTGNSDSLTGCTTSSSINVSYAAVPTYTGFSVTKCTFNELYSSISTSQKFGLVLGTGIIAGTVSGNTFNLNQNTSTLVPNVGINVIAAVTGVTISTNTFTGTAGTGINITAGPTLIITGNTFTGLESAVKISGTPSAVTITNNTISNGITNYASTSVYVGAIEVNLVGTPILNIQGNAIYSNAGYSVDIANAGTNLLSTYVTGNDFHANAKGMYNASTVAYVAGVSTGTLSTVQNWWGNVTGPANATLNPSGTGDAISTGISFSPVLTVGPSAGGSAVVSAAQAGVATTFDFSTKSGVTLVGFTGPVNTIIGTEKLTGNPKTGFNPPYPAISSSAYFDVYTSASSTTAFQVKFYASGITANTQAYYYSTLSNGWVLASSQGVAGTGDFVYVNVGLAGAGVAPSVNDFTGTPFVLVSGTGTTPAAFTIIAPTVGANMGLTNISFTWAPVANVTSYEFIMADNSGFTTPLVDQKALPLPVYQYSGANLTAGKTYFWRVIAYQGSNVVGNSQIGYFTAATPATTAVSTSTSTSTTTVTAPAVTSTVTPITVTNTTITYPQATSTILPTPTVVITTNPQATIIFTNPAPVVTTYTLPTLPVTEVTPAWIWGVIGIGAVLIIVVIVLIVRTRRSV
jgi:hypothetical protein